MGTGETQTSVLIWQSSCGSGCAGLLDDVDLCAAARIAGKTKILLLVLLVVVFCRQGKSMQPVFNSLWRRLLILKEIPEYPVCATRDCTQVRTDGQR